MQHVFGNVSGGTLVFLIAAVGLALSFEFVNGFHDTANAVATVIYTNTLKPGYAVVWSGLWNLVGVLTSAGTVAFGIVALLPVELVINVGTGAGFAMVFSLLISAMIWNLGTWYFGLPASSSHTLIGSIVGVGLANSMIAGSHTFGDGELGKVQIRWRRSWCRRSSISWAPGAVVVDEMVAALELKELVGRAADLGCAPCCAHCTGVSFAHGSNDGQKGMGPLMLILMASYREVYALNPGLGAPAVINRRVCDRGIYFEKQAKNAAPLAAGRSRYANAFLKTSGTLTDDVWIAPRPPTTTGAALAGKKFLSDVPEADRGAPAVRCIRYPRRSPSSTRRRRLPTTTSTFR